ncbi:cytochrome P450 87A3 [Zea mays]|uniref:Cytochrome P450 family 87 subfamily A polypeptide 2 n=1 Tax=Zea mays TaxID=4577 RepID=A0A1D6GLN7_MAIZE|nr:cytochrome P450 87A3 [Zea mays]AQK64225.1 cytochrome P450 family 87 subfamily A polypeptide 2 [Zea mays]AQK64226.1 cytochrome P450 family 87 subfamily A polypeptide 2 [Zea mays]
MSMDYLAAAVPVTLALGVGSILLVLRWTYCRRRTSAEQVRLPPGSRGLLFLGETLHYLAASSTPGVLPPFFQRRLERYGPIFRTNLVGEDLVVSLDAELNAHVLKQEERGFQIWYPPSFMRVFGADNITAKLGVLHHHMRTLVLRLFGHQTVRSVLLHDVQRSARDELRSWLGRPDVEVRTATSRMIFGVTAKKLISHDDAASGETLWRCFHDWTSGLLSFPVSIPGTTFYRCMQGRKKVMTMLKQQLVERRRNAAERETTEDFFDLVIDELNKPDPMMDESTALDLLFTMLFASHETTSMVLTVILKYLTDNPKALQELTEEHERILESRANPGSDLTWEEYKSMKFTSHVIHESLRLANIALAMFRKANQDVHINGYTIPKGSKIMMCALASHLNTEVYEDPSVFNPWRWKDIPEPVGTSKDFMAFGGGLRLCAGAEFSKMQMAMFLHYLVTNYSWKPVSGGTMLFYPGLQFPEGFHIQLLPKIPNVVP